ncbi:MAG: ankyrin repeat domain-containing protein [Candidatus Protochlamydia sp.]|nr:ankyrin repeat domain-containing protein [Candidatus Protochlamydia sp.]
MNISEKYSQPVLYNIDQYGEEHDFYKSITSNTSTNEFLNKWESYPEITLRTGVGRLGATPLHIAAERGNIELINFIISIGGKTLLNTHDSYNRTPLHCAIECKDQDKGYLAATRLIALGTFIDIVPENPQCKSNPTPLECALREMGNQKNKVSKIASFLQNKGATIRTEFLRGSPIDKKMYEIVAYENAKLFKMGASSEGTLKALPTDVIDSILQQYILLMNNCIKFKLN